MEKEKKKVQPKYWTRPVNTGEVEKGWFTVVPSMHYLKGNVSARGQALYLWLCFHANQEGTCFPTVKTLMREAGIGSRQTFYKALDELLKKRLVTYEQRFKANSLEFTSNEYKVWFIYPNKSR